MLWQLNKGDGMKVFCLAVSIILFLMMPIMADADDAATGKGPDNFYVSRDLGISMEVPYVEDRDEINSRLAMFFLPVSNGFSPNINVLKQKFPGAMAEYDKLSLNQFTTMKWNLLKHSVNEKEIIYEYTGSMQGKDFHWYARALRSGDYIYLITATALESQWKDVQAEMLKSVNSFKVDK